MMGLIVFVFGYSGCPNIMHLITTGSRSMVDHIA
uniref:Uncharacterized protein n=1 Tax=Arundo donax TaxID=35708 RepID=A0A0A9ESN4_ARUDO